MWAVVRDLMTSTYCCMLYTELRPASDAAACYSMKQIVTLKVHLGVRNHGRVPREGGCRMPPRFIQGYQALNIALEAAAEENQEPDLTCRETCQGHAKVMLPDAFLAASRGGTLDCCCPGSRHAWLVLAGVAVPQHE